MLYLFPFSHCFNGPENDLLPQIAPLNELKLPKFETLEAGPLEGDEHIYVTDDR